MTYKYHARHPLATTLALLIYARRAEGPESSTHDVLCHLADIADWSDERKADLYALIAESVTAADPFFMVDAKVNDALWTNEDWARRYKG